MKKLFALLPMLFITAAFAADPPAQSAAAPAAQTATHRYLIERTFPAGALDTLDAAAKARINATNARFDVHWLSSYATADKTRPPVNRISVGSKCMKNPYHIRLLRIQLAECMITKMIARQYQSGLQFKGILM